MNSILVVICLFTVVTANRDELIKELLANSSTLSKPEGVTKVEVGISLVTVHEIEVEETTNLDALGWLKLSWVDERLSFDKSKYGVDAIRIPSDQVWIPDVVLYNSAEAVNVEPCNVIVNPDGSVLYIPKMTFVASCDSKSRKLYPMDSVNCDLKFGSWTFSSEELSLNLMGEGLALEDYKENTQWELSAGTSEKREKKYDCCPEIYEDVTFALSFKRKPSAIQVLLIFPGIMTAILTMAMFILPPECREKATFGAILFLSLIVMIAILTAVVPSGPIAVVGYYAVNLAFVTLALFWHTCVVLMAYPSNSSVRPHRLLRRFAGGFSVISCISNEHLELSEEDADDGMSNSAKGARNIAEWRFVARMLDRLMLIIFTLLLILLGVLSIGF